MHNLAEYTMKPLEAVTTNQTTQLDQDAKSDQPAFKRP